MKLFKIYFSLIPTTIVLASFNWLGAQCPIRMVSPSENAILKQVRIAGGKIQTVWTFKWTPCSTATKYHLYVKGPGALNPIINDSSIRQNSYKDSAVFMGSLTVLNGWMAKVRAFENGAWGEWSELRTFNAAPVPAAITGFIKYPTNWGNKEKLKQIWLLNPDGSIAGRARVNNNNTYTFLNVSPGIEYTIQPGAFGTDPEKITLKCLPDSIYKKHFTVWRVPIDD